MLAVEAFNHAHYDVSSVKVRQKGGKTLNQFEDFMALTKEGRIEEAQSMIEAEKVRCKYSPDTITSEDGKPPLFTKKGKPVEQGEDGQWRLKQ